MSKICVFIHGYLTNYQDFTILPQTILKDYDQVILLTMPGHECKENLNNFTRKKTMDYLNKEMKEICNDNNVVDVIGFSMGGALAWYAALKYQINKLVLLSPAVMFFNLALPFDRLRYRKSLDKLSDEEKKQAIEDLKEHDKEALEFVKSTTYPKFNLLNGFVFCQVINEIFFTKGKIKCPMLIIRGNLDELVPELAVEQCYKRCLNSKKEIFRIPEVGHMLLRTKKESEIIDKVTSFLRGE